MRVQFVGANCGHTNAAQLASIKPVERILAALWHYCNSELMYIFLRRKKSKVKVADNKSILLLFVTWYIEEYFQVEFNILELWRAMKNEKWEITINSVILVIRPGLFDIYSTVCIEAEKCNQWLLFSLSLFVSVSSFLFIMRF